VTPRPLPARTSTSHAAPLRSPHRRRLARVALGAALVLGVGNLAVVAAVPVARASEGTARPAQVAGVDHLRALDDRVWRGNAPTEEGYADLARAGVRTVVDLRAERDLDVPTDLLAELGLRRVHLPIRDGQTPTTEQVAALLRAVEETDGIVYVHCGAGVGRSGSMSAAYLVAAGSETPTGALRRSLSVGPPSLEQIRYMSTVDTTGAGEDGIVTDTVRAASRVLDAPRRTWSRLHDLTE
jgi:protein-tyrosine phosphatase